MLPMAREAMGISMLLLSSPMEMPVIKTARARACIIVWRMRSGRRTARPRSAPLTMAMKLTAAPSKTTGITSTNHSVLKSSARYRNFPSCPAGNAKLGEE